MSESPQAHFADTTARSRALPLRPAEAGAPRDVLTVSDLHVAYLKKEILHGLSLRVAAGEVVALVGSNGSGKSTLLRAIAGLTKPKSGSVAFRGSDIVSLAPHEVNRLGIAYLIQGGEVFPNLAVWENLSMALNRVENREHADRLGLIYDAFPKLSDLSARRAGLLSGGEREMLAIGMVLVQRPQIALLDEPSAGLAPALVADVLHRIRTFALRHQGAVLLVEQNVRQALAVSDRVYRLADGTAQEVSRESVLGVPSAAGQGEARQCGRVPSVVEREN